MNNAVVEFMLYRDKDPGERTEAELRNMRRHVNDASQASAFFK